MNPKKKKIVLRNKTRPLFLPLPPDSLLPFSIISSLFSLISLSSLFTLFNLLSCSLFLSVCRQTGARQPNKKLRKSRETKTKLRLATAQSSRRTYKLAEKGLSLSDLEIYVRSSLTFSNLFPLFLLKIFFKVRSFWLCL